MNSLFNCCLLGIDHLPDTVLAAMYMGMLNENLISVLESYFLPNLWLLPSLYPLLTYIHSLFPLGKVAIILPDDSLSGVTAYRIIGVCVCVEGSSSPKSRLAGTCEWCTHQSTLCKRPA